MAQDVAQSLGDLGAGAAPVSARLLGSRLGLLDEEDGQAGHGEAGRVDQDGERRTDQLDQPTGQARPGHLGGRLAGGQLAVAVGELVSLDQHRQVRLVGHVEEHRQHAGHEGHQVELAEGQATELVGDRDREQGHEPAGIGHHQHRSLGQAVDPDAGVQRHQDEGGELDG